jgi:hypothetical protein
VTIARKRRITRMAKYTVPNILHTTEILANYPNNNDAWRTIRTGTISSARRVVTSCVREQLRQAIYSPQSGLSGS